MDTSMPDRAEAGEADNAGSAPRSGQEPSVDSVAPPPSSSTLSDVPESDRRETDSDTIVVAGPTTSTQAPIQHQSNVARPNAQPIKQIAHAPSGLATPNGFDEGASNVDEMVGTSSTQNQPLQINMATSSQFPTPALPPIRGTPRGRTGRPPGRPRGSGRGRGRGGQRPSLDANGTTTASDGSMIKVEGADPRSTPGSGVRPRGVGRGRGGGRPRGSRARGGGRGGKRKRDDDDEADEVSELSDSSDEVTPVATMTKSGRNVHRPTSFVPPPQSPSTTAPTKRQRPYTHRNPQAAVCKVCLRGTSPASNPVVFCDGCNAPYHRWCHKPAVEQAVIDEEDKQWHCRTCEEERMVPVAESQVAGFIGLTGQVSEDERRNYFSTLPSGMLITLLVKASTLKPDLPLFDPNFKPAPIHEAGANGQASAMRPPPQPRFNGVSAAKSQRAADDAAYTPGVHPENYPRPGRGLMSTLPPDREDLEHLVDDDDKYGVYTHLYQAGPPPAKVSQTSMPPVAVQASSAQSVNGRSGLSNA